MGDPSATPSSPPVHSPERSLAGPGAGAGFTRPWDQAGWHGGGVLYSSPLVSIGYTSCRPHGDGLGPEYRLGVDVVAFPRRGVFTMHVGGERFQADANQVLFQNSDDVFRTSHPGCRGDSTTWIAVERGALVDGMASSDPGVRDRRRAFPWSHGACDPGTFLLHRALIGSLGAGGGARDGVLVEEVAIRLVGRALRGAGLAAGAGRGCERRASTERAHAETVEAAKRAIALGFTGPLSIAEVARAAHASPFHLCRVFRARAGVSIHGYLNRLRLREAVERMIDGRSKLAGVALASGFASHSHFTDAFRREFSVPPSDVRGWTSGRLREALARLSAWRADN